MNKDPRKNASGCYDLTPYEVIKREQIEEDRFHDTLRAIKMVCKLGGYDLAERVILIDKESGKIWK